MQNKRYIRLSKRMKAHCKGKCNGGLTTECQYYSYCFNGRILCPKRDTLKYLQEQLKGKKLN